jgi:hypothetical protein
VRPLLSVHVSDTCCFSKSGLSLSAKCAIATALFVHNVELPGYGTPMAELLWRMCDVVSLT